MKNQISNYPMKWLAAGTVLFGVTDYFLLVSVCYIVQLLR